MVSESGKVDAPTLRGVRAILVVAPPFLLALGSLVLGAGPVWSQECIDYGSYLRPAGSVDTPYYAEDVALAGSCAYVACLSGGLQIVDAANPYAPVIVGNADTPRQAQDVDVADGVAYVVDRDGGLQVVDVSDPAAPYVIGSAPTPDDLLGIDVDGGYVYTAHYTADVRVYLRQCGLSSVAEPVSPESGSAMLSAVPNPFRSSAWISYDSPEPLAANLSVYDVSGRLVRLLESGRERAGSHQVVWDGRDDLGRHVPPGVYFLRLETGNHLETRRLIVVR